MILKSPMKLQSLSTLKMHPDVLGEKIRANYRLIGTDITSEDFLHMTMQEPALFMNLENHQTLVVENHVDTKNALKLELANQLLNRIMLINSSHFTYQDEVFVASILQKMGILNVEEFIQQVRRHMEHNALLAGLFRQYVQYHLEHAHQTDISNSFGTLKKEYPLERYLHNEIFKRLMTADCNNIMYVYHNQTNNKTSSESIRNAAWMEQADAIMLTQYREKLIDWRNPVHWQEYMNYEIKPLGKEELTEHRILQRITAAVLENMIQKICYEQQRIDHNDRIWKDYTSIFYQSAADVIKRFEDFQSRKVLDVRQYAVYEQGMSELVQDEWKLIHLLQSFEWNQGTENNVVSNINQNSSQYDTVFEMVMRSIWENRHLQKLLAGRMQIEERFTYQTQQQNMDFETYLINEAAYMDERKELQESGDLLLTALQNVNEETPANRLDWMLVQRTDTNRDIPIEFEQMTPTIISKAASFLQDTRMMEAYNSQWIRQTHQGSQQEQNEQNRQTHQGSHQEQNDKYEYADEPQQSNSNDSYNYMEIFLDKYKDFASDQSVPLMENAELLEQVNQHNLYMKTLLESKGAAGQNTFKHVRVDKEKARRDALRALENPQVVLNEAGYREEEAVIHHQSRAQLQDSTASSQHSQGDDSPNFASQMISHMKSHTADRMIENAGTSYSSVHHDKAETSDNSIHGEEADISYSSIHGEEADISYNSIHGQKADILHSSIYDKNAGILYHSIHHKNIETSYDSIHGEEADILYSSIHDENTGILYHSIRNEEADHLYRSIRDDKAETSDNSIHNEKADITYRSIRDENTETSYNSSSSENTDISYGHINHENASIFYHSIHNESINAAYNRTMNDMSKRSAAVYAILKQIRENENRLCQEPLLYDYPDKILYGVSEPHNRVLADGAKGIANQIAVHTAGRKAPSFQETAHIELVHKKEGTVSEEMIQYAAEQIMQSSREQNIKQSQIIQAQTEQGQAAQKQLQDIGQEQIAQLVSQNLKTQVHTISDRVYLELERRLKNEQRRRGY